MYLKAIRLNSFNPRYLFCSSLKEEPILTIVQLIDKKPINHDSYIFKLKFIDRPFRLGIGQHFRIVENIPTY
jgi:hypothetical protein